MFTDAELQTHRLTNLGSLSAGVAHDLNNLFSGALTFTAMLQSKVTDREQLNYLHLIEKTLNKATHLTNGILDFIAEEDQEVQPINPLLSVRDTANMFRRTLRPGIELDLTLPAKNHPVQIRRGELCQIVLNLLVNARDAIGEAGKIRVTGIYQPKQDPLTFALKVEDTGGGIEEKDLEQIFTQFFTTKDKSEGSGLGLAIVKQLVEQRGGRIQVQSNPGEGACFSLTFPVTTIKESKRMSEHAPSIVLFELTPESESPLAQMLQSHDHSVMISTDPKKPFGPSSPKLAILNLLSCTDAAELLWKDLRQRHPGIRTLICAQGLPKKPWGSLSEVSFLEKPFSPELFERTVHRLLDKRGSTEADPSLN